MSLRPSAQAMMLGRLRIVPEKNPSKKTLPRTQPRFSERLEEEHAKVTEDEKLPDIRAADHSADQLAEEEKAQEESEEQRVE